MNAIQHKYPYAINDDGLPIFIDEVNQDNRRQTHYHCYGCGAELFPVLGDVREHHFRHSKDAICDPNKYLHEFAKAAIKKRFDESDTFIVKFKATQKCKKYNDCEFTNYNWPECNHFGFYELDLKKLYDTCTPEKGYYVDLPEGKKKYIADLKLTHSTNNIKPVTIEIWVTHECTEDKKLNGGQIIEIKVNSEDDAYREIVQSDDEFLPIRFFNFKIEVEPSRVFKHVKLLPGITLKVPVTDETLCEEGLIYDPKAENEVIISENDINPDYLLQFYATNCCEKGIRFPLFHICKYSQEYNRNGQRIFECIINNTRKKCPCNEAFIYDAQKGESILKQIQDANIPYWEKSKE